MFNDGKAVAQLHIMAMDEKERAFFDKLESAFIDRNPSEDAVHAVFEAAACMYTILRKVPEDVRIQAAKESSEECKRQIRQEQDLWKFEVFDKFMQTL